MSKHDDGGPAYPIAMATPFGDGYMSMCSTSLLDYFAGQALAGMDASGMDDQNVATHAYSIAAAMIAEKRRREGGEA